MERYYFLDFIIISAILSSVGGLGSMAAVQLATKIDDKVKRALEKLCQQRGLKMNRFIEEALLDKMEELEDAEEVTKLRQEATRPLSHILRELKADGKL